MSNTTLYADRLNEVSVADCNSRLVHPGDHVRLLYPHPHAGRVGIYKGVERTITGWMCLVRFEDGEDGCYVKNASQWKKEDHGG